MLAADKNAATAPSSAVDDVTLRRFRQLFSGNESAHGQYDLSASAGRQAKTLRVQPRMNDWKRHLTGEGPGLGIIPIREDNSCLWGAIDLDDDGTDLAALAAAIEARGLPLVLFRSKSGGAHMVLFLSEPTPAATVQSVLSACAKRLSLEKNHNGRPVEIFPKQSTLSANAVGNWLNLPLRGGDSTDRYAVSPSGERMGFVDALTYCESKRVTRVQLDGLNNPFAADGPPCLEALHDVGFPEGTRNQGLFNVGAAFKLLHPNDWQDRLAAYNESRLEKPLADAELTTILRSLEKKDYAYQCDEAPIVMHCQKALCGKRAAGYRAAAGASTDLTVSDEFTDVSVAERFADQFGDRVRFCKPLGGWFLYDGKRWRLDETEQIREFVKELAKSIYAEKLEELSAASARDRVAAHKRAISAHGLLQRRKLDDVASVARSSLSISHHRFDADPYLLNCANGTLDLRTLKLRQHSRDDFVTKSVDAEFDMAATCPRWEQFITEITEDAEQAAFLQRAVGSCLTGSVSDQVAFLLHGKGANGKTVFLEVLRELFGDYARKAAFDTFLHKGDGGPRNDLIRLIGARLVTASEAGEGQRFNEALLKEITGGDTLAARKLYCESIEFTLGCKIFFATNHPPDVRGVDEGIWRRLLMVPFNLTIPAEKRDPRLLDTLRGEMTGILAWAVRGYEEWKRIGLRPPEVITRATRDYRDDNDILRDWLDECVGEQQGAEVSKSDLHTNFIAWARNHGHYTLTKNKFGRKLKDRGWKDAQRGAVKVWLDHRIIRHEPF